MSSVGSSDSSNATNSNKRAEDQTRRTSETAKKSESELVKKQAKELRRLNEEHYAEVESLKDNHNAQMEDLRQGARDAISERDHRYQQDIEEVRDVYRKQLQEQAEESGKREGEFRKAVQGEKTQNKSQTESRTQRLATDYDKNLAERQHIYEESIKEAREKQNNSIQENREALAHKYEEQLKSAKEERNERVSGLQKGFDEYRGSAESRLRDQEMRHFQDQERSSKELLRTANKERMDAQSTQEMMRDGFREDINQNKEKFEKAARKEREANAFSRDDLKSTAMDRINNQVTRLEDENHDLREAQPRQDIETKSKFHREMTDVTDAYQKNIDAYKKERDGIVRASNDRSHKNIEKVRTELEGQAVENNRANRVRQDDQDRIHNLAFENLKTDTQIREQATKDIADTRVKRMYENTEDDKFRLINLQEAEHTASQHSHQDDLRALRANMEADKQVAVHTLTERLEKQEAQHNERMNMVVSKYEKQIQALKDQVVHEKKNGDDNVKRVVEEMQRMHKVELDQVDAKDRERLRMANQQHADEVRTLNKRSEEKMDQVLGEIKRT